MALLAQVVLLNLLVPIFIPCSMRRPTLSQPEVLLSLPGHLLSLHSNPQQDRADRRHKFRSRRRYVSRTMPIYTRCRRA